MVLKFEEYIKSKDIIKESYQSGKLRNIIKQHGKPKNKWDYKLLYDIKDSDIVDVVSSSSEFFDKYQNNENNHNKNFFITLEDDYCVVIGNVKILDSYWSRDNDTIKKSFLYKRHKKRHEGNLGDWGGDEINIKFKNKLEHQKNLKVVKTALTDEVVKEILDVIQDYINNWDGNVEKNYMEHEMKIPGQAEISLSVNYDTYIGEEKRHRGAILADIGIDVESFELSYCNEEYVDTDDYIDDTFTNVELDIDLSGIEPYEERNADVGVYDYYAYYGVSPADFY